jgi:hypothetical protein
MAQEKPKLFYQVTIERKPFFRRFMWWLMGGVTSIAALGALALAADRQVVDANILTVGQIVAIVVTILAFLRALLNLMAGMRRRNETVRIFDQGFAWKRDDKELRYKWEQVATYREAIHERKILGRKSQRGALELKMINRREFKIMPLHGDVRHIAKFIRPIIADITGTAMGRALRNEKTVRLHRELALWSGGVKAGQHEIPWAELDVGIKNGMLIIRRKGEDARFKPVKRYAAGEINNLGGFMEIVTTTIPNYQPDRFNIQTQGIPGYEY